MYNCIFFPRRILSHLILQESVEKSLTMMIFRWKRRQLWARIVAMGIISCAHWYEANCVFSTVHCSGTANNEWVWIKCMCCTNSDHCDEGLDCAPADVWQDLQTGTLPDTRHTDRPCQTDQCSSKLMQCIADTNWIEYGLNFQINEQNIILICRNYCAAKKDFFDLYNWRLSH